MALFTASRLMAAAAGLFLLATSTSSAPDVPEDEVCPQFITETAVAGGTLVFTLSGGSTSMLWRTDGTAEGTFPLHAGRDQDQSEQAILASVGETVLFIHDTPHGPLELWRTDGTIGGTGRLAALIFGYRQDVYGSVELNGRRVLAACGSPGACRLWVTDGTEAGTVALTDFRPGFDDDSKPRFDLVARDGVVFLVWNWWWDGTHTVWRTDGTPAGTTKVSGADDPFPPPPSRYCAPGQLSEQYEPATGAELWACDAAGSTLTLVADINPGPASSQPGWSFNPVGEPGVGWPGADGGPGSTFLFSAFEPTSGRELWRSDGTAAGTVRVADIKPGPVGSYPFPFRTVNGTLLFMASGSSGRAEFWLSDGTTAGTVHVADIGSFSTQTVVDSFATVNDAVLVLFPNRDVWLSDGTEPGTALVARGVQPYVLPYFLPVGAVNGATLFPLTDATGARRLWRTNGTPAGTMRLADVTPGTFFGVVNGAFLFTASGDAGDRGLWRSDGTPAGTIRVADIDSGPFALDARVLTWADDARLFTACGENACELWQTDGTAAGTILVARFPRRLGFSVDEAPGLASVDGTLFFSGRAADGSLELWKTNGTPAGTVYVATIPPDCTVTMSGSTTTTVPAPDTTTTTVSTVSTTTSVDPPLTTSTTTTLPVCSTVTCEDDDPCTIARCDETTGCVFELDPRPGIACRCRHARETLRCAPPRLARRLRIRLEGGSACAEGQAAPHGLPRHLRAFRRAVTRGARRGLISSSCAAALRASVASIETRR